MIALIACCAIAAIVFGLFLSAALYHDKQDDLADDAERLAAERRR